MTYEPLTAYAYSPVFVSHVVVWHRGRDRFRLIQAWHNKYCSFVMVVHKDRTWNPFCEMESQTHGTAPKKWLTLRFTDLNVTNKCELRRQMTDSFLFFSGYKMRHTRIQGSTGKHDERPSFAFCEKFVRWTRKIVTVKNAMEEHPLSIIIHIFRNRSFKRSTCIFE